MGLINGTKNSRKISCKDRNAPAEYPVDFKNVIEKSGSNLNIKGQKHPGKVVSAEPLIPSNRIPNYVVQN